MAKPIDMNDVADREDLQALFDSIAAGAPPPPPPPAAPAPDANGDSDDLQALFDSVAAAQAERGQPERSQAERGQAECVQPARGQGLPEHGSGAHAAPAHDCEAVYTRLGKITRALHDSLRELGYDRILKNAVEAIPDARERLSYIAQMTEQAASRALNAIEIAKPIQDDVEARARTLSSRWLKVYARELDGEGFKALADDTHAFLRELPERSRATNEQLMEIMMAQDFQDLTGQVIKKVVDIAQLMESQLLALLLDAMPQQARVDAGGGMLNGPVISAQGRSDVVTSQSQVDELLDSLGF